MDIHFPTVHHLKHWHPSNFSYVGGLAGVVVFILSPPLFYTNKRNLNVRSILINLVTIRIGCFRALHESKPHKNLLSFSTYCIVANGGRTSTKRPSPATLDDMKRSDRLLHVKCWAVTRATWTLWWSADPIPCKRSPKTTEKLLLPPWVGTRAPLYLV